MWGNASLQACWTFRDGRRCAPQLVQCTSVVSDGVGAKSVTRCGVAGKARWGALLRVRSDCALAHDKICCLHAGAPSAASRKQDFAGLLLFVGRQAAQLRVAVANECLESGFARQH